MDCIKHYVNCVTNFCNEMKLDFFPQVEASELLYKVITLEDIYLPLSLSSSFIHGNNIDDIIRRIDEKIAELEQEEAREKGELQDSLASANESYDTGIRLLIEADPGCGKTTFCKRLVLAILNNEDVFFDKYSRENNIQFNKIAMPIFICCKSIADFSVEEMNCLNFKQILYRLCLRSLRGYFSQISEKEFNKIFDLYDTANLCIIFDGWDEILDEEKEAVFCRSLNFFLAQCKEINIIITIRRRYPSPKLFLPYSAHLEICDLSDNDIREFCKKWCEIILNTTQRRVDEYTAISEQILNSTDSQVRAMMRNPLDLSLLLTVSKKDGRLPENKAELFKELVELYIYWSTIKSMGSLSSKSIRVLLSYIASYFTKKKLLFCDENELIHIIEQAVVDLEWAFSEDISVFSSLTIAKELSHTGILTTTFDGKKYTFAGNSIGTHRQMQEYLTAYAILAQYSDDEYNNMSQIDILEDKYEIRQWREVVIFISLMDNGRLRQDIIKHLIAKAEEKPDDNYNYTNLLFDIIVNGADIRSSYKHKIYDILFSQHITDVQITGIYLLVTGAKKNSSDFVTYINTMFSNSVKNGDSEYGFAKAMIEASLSLQQGVLPFERAETLMRSDSDADIITGSQILLLMAWCKYANIKNAFSAYPDNYRLSSNWIQIIKHLLREQRCKTELLKSIRESIIAEFATFYDFFSVEMINEACLQISDIQKQKDCEIILSIAPIVELSFQRSSMVDNSMKEKYINKLNDEIVRKEYDEAIFSYAICVSIGCFSVDEERKKWGNYSVTSENCP